MAPFGFGSVFRSLFFANLADLSCSFSLNLAKREYAIANHAVKSFLFSECVVAFDLLQDDRVFRSVHASSRQQGCWHVMYEK